MAIRYCWSGSGVTARANSTAYSTGARIVIALTDTAGNFAVARRYVWECTTAGTSGAAVPTWPASVTADTTTLTDGTVTWTARNPGYSSGTTENWTFATIYFLYAVAAANASGDLIYVQYTHSETLTATTTYTFTANVSVISVNKDSSNAPTVQGTNGFIGDSTTGGRNITVAGSFKVYFYGITFRSGTTASQIALELSDATTGDFTYESCYFYWVAGGGGNTIAVVLGRPGSASSRCAVKCISCTFRFGAAAGRISLGSANVEWNGCTIEFQTNRPTTLFSAGDAGAGDYNFVGCDFSVITGTLVGDQTNAARTFRFTQCRLGSGVNPFATQTAVTRGAEAYFFDCNSGDVQTSFAYYNAFGSVVSNFTIYYTTGAAAQSWLVTSFASNATYYTPFITPFIDWYNSNTSTSVTPYIEIIRDGSSTAYKDNEVWGEFFAKTGATNTPISTEYSDRMTVLGTAVNLNTGAGAGAWTGESATIWSGKVESGAAFTPSEIGAIRGRIVVGLANTSFYVDPQIRT